MADIPETDSESFEALRNRAKTCERAYLKELRTGKPPKDEPEGYDAFKRHVGPAIERELEAQGTARQRRRWERIDKVAKVAAIVGSLAAIATLILTIWFGLSG